VLKKYRVEIGSAAQRDVESIQAYIARDKPFAAEEWVRDVRAKVLSLETLPERSEVLPESRVVGKDIRHLLFGNYRIIYRVRDDVVYVVRIIQASRRLKKSMLPPP
jgi:plasmid stabilization system protein ParE